MHDQEQGAGTRFDKRGLALTTFRLQRVGDRSEQRLAAACCSGLAGDGRNGNSRHHAKSRGQSGPRTIQQKQRPVVALKGSGTDKVLDHMSRAGVVLLRYLVSVYHPTRYAPSGCAARTNALDKSWSQERTECRIRSLGCLFFPCSSPPFLHATQDTSASSIRFQTAQPDDVDDLSILLSFRSARPWPFPNAHHVSCGRAAESLAISAQVSVASDSLHPCLRGYQRPACVVVMLSPLRC